MTALSHTAARQAAQLAADGRLDAADQAALDAHLRACADCRAYAAELAAVEQTLRRALASRWEAAAARGPAPDLAGRLARPGGLYPMRSSRLDWIGRAAGALAVLALVLAVAFTLQWQSPPLGPAAETETPTAVLGLDSPTPFPLPTGIAEPTRHFEPLPTTYSVQADFPGLATLDGYTVVPMADHVLNIFTVWHVPAAPAVDYVLTVQLEDGAGLLVAQSDSSPASHRATSQWLPGEYAEVALWLALPADLPPGDYTLYAVAYEAQTGQRLPPASGDLTADGRVRLGVLKLLLTATVTPTPIDWLPASADCAAVACTPTPALCYGQCPIGADDLSATVPPCDPALSVCPEPSGTPLPFPSFTPCEIGCGEGTPTPTALPLPTAIADYTVQPGDTCQTIAAAYGTTVDVLLALNPGLDCNNLAAGQVIQFPLTLTATPLAPPTGQPNTYVVQAGDTCQGIADSYGIPLEILLVANGLSDCLSITVGYVLVIPVGPIPSSTPCPGDCPGVPTPPPPTFTPDFSPTPCTGVCPPTPTPAPTIPPRPT
jgi:LysM repeat protein